VESFITLAHGGKLKYRTVIIYHRILNLENVGTAVNYRGIFKTLAPGKPLEPGLSITGNAMRII
jgi:hypothetical protein